MGFRLHRLLFLVLFSSTGCLAVPDASADLLSARSLRCEISNGIETSWPNAKPETKPAPHSIRFTFDSIDVRAGTARVITQSDAGDLRVVASAFGLSFIELDPGVIDVTTVYAQRMRDGKFVAVETRHAAFGGQALAEQFYGRCSILQ